MGTGPLDRLLAGQPVRAHALHQAHQQRMSNGPSSDGWERQQRMATVCTSEPSLCNLERMGTGLRGELLAGQPVSAHALHLAHQQWMRNGLSSDGLERQHRMATVFTSEPPLCKLERMGMGLLDDQLAGQPVSTHTWHHAHQQRPAPPGLAQRFPLSHPAEDSSVHAVDPAAQD